MKIWRFFWRRQPFLSARSQLIELDLVPKALVWQHCSPARRSLILDRKSLSEFQKLKIIMNLKIKFLTQKQQSKCFTKNIYILTFNAVEG